jgi:transitional endoplasmic reticulum ATPase
MKHLLKKHEVVNDTYEVQCHIGQGAFGDVYRVKHKYLGLQVLKVFKEEYANQADIQTITREAKILSKLTHPNIVRVFETNSFQKDRRSFHFITMGFVSGESLAQLLIRKIVLPLPVALSIIQDILTGLSIVHANSPPIVHRDISPDNILLSYDGEKPRAMLSDFGLAQFSDHTQKLARSAGKYVYMAPECFWDVYLPASDVFSAGVVFYRMIAGIHPWDYDLDDIEDPDDIVTAITVARKKPVRPPSFQHEHFPGILESALLKSLSLNFEDRYLNAGEFLKEVGILFGSLTSLPASSQPSSPVEKVAAESTNVANDASGKKFKVRVAEKGFDQIAGMDELKEILYHDVIMPLQEKELYAQYKLTIPNGMLLYGPPGCGKTFIAKMFAEEVGFTFFSIKPSDVASTYIHGTQEKIRDLFEKARQHAPSIVFIDEVDAMMPSRGGQMQHNYSAEVNEFLAQMTECGKANVFLIAATNRPDMIDPAILRTGRLDKLFYLPPPDRTARSKMFQIHLKGRPKKRINLEKLADLTENYVASDITFLVDEAARKALREREPVKQSHIEEAIEKHQPSISTRQLNIYEKFKNSRSFD